MTRRPSSNSNLLVLDALVGSTNGQILGDVGRAECAVLVLVDHAIGGHASQQADCGILSACN